MHFIGASGAIQPIGHVPAFGVAPIILQNGEAVNLTSTDLVHVLGALCLKTPAAWYSLVTFVLKSSIDLITLAALDHSTLLSEAVSLDVLLELFYSTGLLGLSGRAYYCATHLLTLRSHSIFGSGNVLLVVKVDVKSSRTWPCLLQLCSVFALWPLRQPEGGWSN